MTFYLPSDIFYDLYTLKPINSAGQSITYSSVAFTDIPVHVKGSSIVPARVNSANTTAALRGQDFELLVAPGKDGKASGELYLDDGESLVQAGTSEIVFNFDGKTISANGNFGYKTSVGVLSLTVMGENGPVKYELNEGLEGPWERELGSLKKAGL